MKIATDIFSLVALYWFPFQNKELLNWPCECILTFVSMLVRWESACTRGAWENGWNARVRACTCNINKNNKIPLLLFPVKGTGWLKEREPLLDLVAFPFISKRPKNYLLLEMSLIQKCVTDTLKVGLQTMFVYTVQKEWKSNSWTDTNSEEKANSST